MCDLCDEVIPFTEYCKKHLDEVYMGKLENTKILINNDPTDYIGKQGNNVKDIYYPVGDYYYSGFIGLNIKFCPICGREL